ncbi:MAG: TVP38/TMEM64 family protein [Rubrobacter sp.]
MLETVQQLIDAMSSGLAGPLIYIVFYALRPLILFPASLLTVAAGFVFGPVLGLFFTVLGSNISASVAYLAGRYFGRGFQDSNRTSNTLQGYAERLQKNSFESVLILRLIFVPFDAVNYAAGLLHVRYRPFVLATVLGSLPGTTSFVLFGASIQGSFTDGTPDLNLWILLASALIAAGSLSLSRHIKRLDRVPRSAPRDRA